jgi:outer membrane lipoprotein-sorting protein
VIAVCGDRRCYAAVCHRVLITMILSLTLSACAARAPVRPSGTATPDPGAIDAFVQATQRCAGLQTLTAELRLSGRAGGEKVRGTIHAGLAAPSALRFEAVAPFGAPVFILAGRDNRASLLLPRENRVLADAAVPAVLERLTGLALAADDLRLILTACLVQNTAPADGRAWPNGWRAVSVGAGITAYLKEIDAVPSVVAADHGNWRVDYANHQNGWPRSVRIRSADEGTSTLVDITAALEQVEINTTIDDKAFVVTPPAGAAPITLDDLRSVAPLKQQEGGASAPPRR